MYSQFQSEFGKSWFRGRNRRKFRYSHFIEHMLLKAQTSEAQKIAEDVDKIAGQINAFTGKEATCYYLKTLSSNIDKAADILLTCL